uniref:Uncharacterized protein LOC111105089 n=1 Tax=Crassostrea virginica TaxID=6565 RepID=A0A8B8AUU8_CRAVI|nr:uncharacterized protein LOC111105089 [Crassostrea virginica]
MEGECVSGKKYCNGNLEPGESYSIRYSVCTDGGCLESDFSETFTTAANLTPVIAGSISVVTLVVIAIIFVIVVVRKKRMGITRSNSSNYENTVQMAVFKDKMNRQTITTNASAYLVQVCSDDAVNKEFQEMFTQKQQTSHEYKIENDKKKHPSIKTIGYCRLPGFSSKTEYLCSAHPSQDMVKDFLNLIVNDNVMTIVMIICKDELVLSLIS